VGRNRGEFSEKGGKGFAKNKVTKSVDKQQAEHQPPKKYLDGAPTQKQGGRRNLGGFLAKADGPGEDGRAKPSKLVNQDDGGRDG